MATDGTLEGNVATVQIIVAANLYRWSLLVHNQVVDPFDPTTDCCDSTTPRSLRRR